MPDIPLHLHTNLIYKIILYIALVISTPALYAASIHTFKPDNNTIQLLNSEANTFTLSQDLRNPNTESVLSISSPQAKTKPIEVAGTQKKLSTKANSFQQQLFNYSDNALAQESLYALYEARLLWDDLDTLADEILFSLKLDQYIDTGLNNFRSPSSFKHIKVNKNIYDKVRRSQKKSKIKSSGSRQSKDDSIFRHLFSKQTIYYLLTSLVIISILARIARFILGFFP